MPRMDRAIERTFDERAGRAHLQTHLNDAEWIGLFVGPRMVFPVRVGMGTGREVLQRVAIRVRIRIVELPSRQQAIDLFAQSAVGDWPYVLLSELRMRRELGEHPHQTMGNRLTTGIGCGLEDFDD